MIILNGRKVKNPKTIENLIKENNLKSSNICILVNGSIVPREKWKDFRIKEGDKVEIVGFVGGG